MTSSLLLTETLLLGMRFGDAKTVQLLHYCRICGIPQANDVRRALSVSFQSL